MELRRIINITYHFNNKGFSIMFNNKKDVLLESVKKVIQESERHRKLEAELNEAYGIVSRAALPNEYVAEYDAILAEAKQTGSLPRNPREKSLAALANPKDRITHKDVLKGRGVIEQTSEEKPIPLSARKSLTTDTGITHNPPSSGESSTFVSNSSGLDTRALDSKVKEIEKEAPNGIKEEHLEEKSVSKAQHRFFRLVRDIQNGKAKGSAEAEKAAKEMSVKQVRDYAKTKEKGLPEKKKR